MENVAKGFFERFKFFKKNKKGIKEKTFMINLNLEAYLKLMWLIQNSESIFYILKFHGHPLTSIYKDGTVFVKKEDYE